MKKIIAVGILLLSFNIYGQEKHANINVFVRVYDMHGEKIAKGKILLISAESIQLHVYGETTIIPVTDIGMIKTKRSGGNNILWGVVIGAVGGAIIAPIENRNQLIQLDQPGVSLAGAIVGGAYGSLAGGITIPFKNHKSYSIEGDTLNLKAFKEAITGIQK